MNGWKTVSGLSAYFQVWTVSLGRVGSLNLLALSVDGSEILHQLIGSLSDYSQGLYTPHAFDIGFCNRTHQLFWQLAFMLVRPHLTGQPTGFCFNTWVFFFGIATQAFSTTEVSSTVCHFTMHQILEHMFRLWAWITCGRAESPGAAAPTARFSEKSWRPCLGSCQQDCTGLPSPIVSRKDLENDGAEGDRVLLLLTYYNDLQITMLKANAYNCWISLNLSSPLQYTTLSSDAERFRFYRRQPLTLWDMLLPSVLCCLDVRVHDLLSFAASAATTFEF